MGGPLDEQKRNTIVRLLFHRCRHNDIAKQLEVSLTVIKKIERNLLEHGTPTQPDHAPKGRPPQLKDDVIEEILQVYEMTGFDIGQKQICQWLEGRHGIKVSQSTISRLIKKSGRKKAVAVVAQAKKIQEEAAQGNTEHAMNDEVFQEPGPGYRHSDASIPESVSDATTPDDVTVQQPVPAAPLDPKLAVG